MSTQSVSALSEQNTPHPANEHVQSDAFSITLSNQDFTILRVSSSADQQLAYTREELIGHPLVTLIGKNQMEILESELKSTSSLQACNPVSCIVCTRYPPNDNSETLILEDRAFDMSLDVSAGSLVAKFKPSLARSPDPVSRSLESIADSIKKIQTVFTIEELLTVSTREIRKMIHVDRVMIYEFKKEDSYIRVVAEDKEPEHRSFLGHHYPSSHLLEHVRIMDKENNSTMPNLLVKNGPHNLSLALMRCMSSAHVKLLDTMDVRFSMSVPIIIDEELWGLIVCHHHSPQCLSHSMRISCELFGHIISSKSMSILTSIESQQIRDYRSNISNVLNSLIGNDEWKEVIIKEGQSLCRLFHSIGLVIYSDSQYFLYGNTPTKEQINLLIPHIISNATENIFVSNCLSSNHADGYMYKDVGSGILALIVSESPSDIIMLFREEMRQMLKWVDNPDDVTVIEGCSEPWSPIDIEMGHELKRYLLQARLRYNDRKSKEEANKNALILEKEAIENAAVLEQETSKRALVDKEEASQRASIAEEHRRKQALFIDTMCHEIRNPINGIIGSVSILHDQIAGMEYRIRNINHEAKTSMIEDLKQLREGLNDINECANHQRIIADDVLSLSKLEQERIRIENTPMNLTHVLQQILHPYKSILDNKGLIMEVNNFNVDIYILGDRNRLKQIISNLLDNAVKFTPSGFIRISARSNGTDKDNQQLFEICIEDSGLGMTKEEIDRLFVAYSQANQGISGKYGGTGLGLVISKELAKLMKGNIAIQSEKGVGTELKFSFASQVISPKEYLRLTSPPSVTRRLVTQDTLEPKRILIAEDNIINQKVLLKMLDKEGYSCDIANNGLEALELYKLRRHAIIFMDIQMPVMDGLQATRLIRELEFDEKSPATYIVCISGNAREEHKGDAFNSGVNIYVVKPIKREEILNIVSALPVSHTGTPVLRLDKSQSAPG